MRGGEGSARFGTGMEVATERDVVFGAARAFETSAEMQYAPRDRRIVGGRAWSCPRKAGR